MGLYPFTIKAISVRCASVRMLYVPRSTKHTKEIVPMILRITGDWRPTYKKIYWYPSVDLTAWSKVQ